MSMLQQAPRLASADAVRLARELYGLDASAHRLPSERDQNFRLDTPSGRFVLKIANAAEPREMLEAQNAAMEHAARVGARCPRPIPAMDGRVIVEGARGHFLRLLTWIPGVLLGSVRHQTPALLEDLGRRVGELDRALQQFDHPAIHRDFHWDLTCALTTAHDLLPLIDDGEWRTLLDRELQHIDARLGSTLRNLRRSAIHNDANDYNVIVEREGTLFTRYQQVVGLIDFGDMVHSLTVADVAVTAAYAALDKQTPLQAATHVVSGYHAVLPLGVDEVGALFDLLKLRLCLSACLAASQQAQRPGDEYLAISQAPIRRTLPALCRIPVRFAEASFRRACGMDPVPSALRIRNWLSRPDAPVSRAIVGDDLLKPETTILLDLGPASPLVASDPQDNAAAGLSTRIDAVMRASAVNVALGRYLEPRLLYSSPLFEEEGGRASERRTIHLGMDFFARPGTAVRAPFAGTVHTLAARGESPAAFGRRCIPAGCVAPSSNTSGILSRRALPAGRLAALGATPGFHHGLPANNTAPLDYGPLVILRHETGHGDEFFTLYGHLTRETLSTLVVGQRIAAGEAFAAIGAPDVNGGWPPHLHFQWILDLLDLGSDFPGVCRASEASLWAAFSPDPGRLLGFPPELGASVGEGTPATTLATRRTHTGRSLRLSYREPLKIVRGSMQYLFDHTGRCFLDAYNNVPHVGHCHPRVVEAAAAQMRVLNTNTRYLHDSLGRFAGRLTATLPDPLRVCYFVNSGSEANELALRLARTHTGHRDVIVLDHAYHGNTTTLIDISPYKFNGPGGSGRPGWVQVVAMPDVFRGAFRGDDSAHRYAALVQQALERIRERDGRPAAFIAETCPSVGGQIVFPPGYLAAVYACVRAAGGLCIADEVQTAYGRMGSSFYAFEDQEIVPDILVLGKPIGNGHPLGAVVTTEAIAESFDNGMEFFTTFGGNTVSCAVGLAVLDVLETEGLQAHAARVGAILLDRLRDMSSRHPLIGDIRGSGLFLGVELVTDRASRAPAGEAADYVVNRLREEGILMGIEGPSHNVLKIRPPMPFSGEDAEFLVEKLEVVLGEAGARTGD